MCVLLLSLYIVVQLEVLTLVGHGGRGKNVSECNGDELEVKERHLSKMLEVKVETRGKGRKKDKERGKVYRDFIAEPRPT